MALLFCFFQSPEPQFPVLEELNNNLIKKNILKKLEETRLRKEKECRSKTIERAEAYVDTLIAQRLFISADDGDLSVPTKPQKPSLRTSNNFELEKTDIKPYFDRIDTVSHQ